MATQCRESGVETLRRPDYPAHPDIVGQETGKPTYKCGELRFAAAVPSGVRVHQCADGNVDVRHLTGGVHSGVGTTSGEQSHRGPEHRRQCAVKDPRNGAEAVLRRPPAEIRSVVGDVKTQTDLRIGVRTGQAQPAPR